MRASDRIPGEDVGRAVERIEVVLELVEDALGDRLGRPALGGVRGADRPRLREEEYLVIAHGEDLPRDLRPGIARKRDGERRDLVGVELLQRSEERRVGKEWASTGRTRGWRV